jgi:hypothetical protein
VQGAIPGKRTAYQGDNRSLIARAGIPIKSSSYFALCIAASFFIFMELLAIGPACAVTVALLMVYFTTTFIPMELVARRMRTAERELLPLTAAIGSELIKGSSLDRAVACGTIGVRSPELRQALELTQQRLIASRTLDGLCDEFAVKKSGRIVASFFSMLTLVSNHPVEEAGKMCTDFSEQLRSLVSTLHWHARFLLLVRGGGCGVVVLLLTIVVGSGLSDPYFEPYSARYLARDLGSVVVALVLAAVARITGLAEWSRYGDS